MHQLQLRGNYDSGDVSWYGLGLHLLFYHSDMYVILIQHIFKADSFCASKKLCYFPHVVVLLHFAMLASQMSCRVIINFIHAQPKHDPPDLENSV
ncbi:hypothetical protein HanPI659440_Chr12g0476921 [Helianthus annuus]|nr:hypothetical protein HanPI659440_Chr12g0476921 [Helianthus annuus]